MSHKPTFSGTTFCPAGIAVDGPGLPGLHNIGLNGQKWGLVAVNLQFGSNVRCCCNQ